MQYLDGVNSGPQSFLGQLGKELQTCVQQQIAEFEPVEILYNFLPTIVLSALINYIYAILLLLCYLIIAH